MLVEYWQGMKTFVDVVSTSDETRSAKVKFLREELARTRPDGVHQKLLLRLEFAAAVDTGVHLTLATYLLERGGMLVSSGFPPTLARFFSEWLLFIVYIFFVPGL